MRVEDQLRASIAEVPGLVDSWTIWRGPRQGFSLRSMPGRYPFVLRARDVRVQPDDEESIAGRADRLRIPIRSLRGRHLLLDTRMSQARGFLLANLKEEKLRIPFAQVSKHG